MSRSPLPPTLIGTLAAVAILLCFMAGYLILHFAQTRPPPAPVAVAAPDNSAPDAVPPVTVSPVTATPITATRASTANSADLTPEENGCSIDLAAGIVHITGTTTQDGWDHLNGVTTKANVPAGDFVVTADFMVPAFNGSGTALVYLRAVSSNDEKIGIFFRRGGMGYRVQAWTNPQRFSSWLKPFGNETTSYHKMKLQYDSASQKATGWIDDNLIGSITAPLSGTVRFQVVANTERADMKIDLYFKNFSVSLPGASPLNITPPLP